MSEWVTNRRMIETKKKMKKTKQARHRKRWSRDGNLKNKWFVFVWQLAVKCSLSLLFRRPNTTNNHPATRGK